MTFFELHHNCKGAYAEFQKEKKLVWNVFVENFNGKSVEVFNIFDHYSFLYDLVNIKKETKKRYAQEGVTLKDSSEALAFFEEEVGAALTYFYWCKSEWEVIVTSWPPYVEGEEIDHLVKEKEKHIKEWGNFYRSPVDLSVGAKVDVFMQVRANWGPFIKYLWDNFDLIKKPKEEIV